MIMGLWISEQLRLLKDNIDGSRTMKLKKTLIAKGTVQRTGTVVEQNAESMQSGAVYIIVFV